MRNSPAKSTADAQAPATGGENARGEARAQLRNRSANLLAGIYGLLAAAQFRKLVLPVCSWIGFSAILLGLSLEQLLPVLGKILMASGALATAVALTLVSSLAKRDVADKRLDKIAGLGDRIAKRIEDLEDARWQVRDSSERMREVLDAQDDAILRYDAHGRLAFVNRAFAARFDVAPDDVLGTAFQIANLVTQRVQNDAAQLVEEEFAHAGDGGACDVQFVETADGARWYCWRYAEIPADDGLSFDRLVVGQDVSARIEHEIELGAARDEAEAADRAKSRFLASMSHEIRTPMNGILGMGGLLMETKLSPEQKTYAEAIDQSARTLLSLIDEILDFSKIEAGHLILNEAPFSPVNCVQDVVELLAPRAFDKDLELTWTFDREVPGLLVGDQARVRQVLLNLIGNAIKYTERGGVSIRVSAMTAPSGDCRLAIAVTDTGEGLSEEEVRLIFTEFERAGADVAGREGGTGLGLAIARRLALAMNGDIEVDTAPGKGATFSVFLELPAVATNSEPRAKPQLVDGQKTALLAFDRLIERRALSRMLRQHGIKVLETSDICDEALIRDLIDQNTGIDLLIIDSDDEPAAAGRLLRRLEDVGGRGVVAPVVLVNPADKDAAAAFRAHGFCGYLTRPVRPSSLLARLVEAGSSENHAVKPDVGTDVVALARQAAQGDEVCEEKTSGPRVLLAEDNDINALLATTMLKRQGCPVVRARTGKEAIDAVVCSIRQDQLFELVMMDLHMPEMDGLTASKRIRTICHDYGAPVPVIAAVTANAFPEDRARCLAAGMDGYLPKPFDREELAQLLANLDCLPTGTASRGT